MTISCKDTDHFYVMFLEEVFSLSWKRKNDVRKGELERERPRAREREVEREREKRERERQRKREREKEKKESWRERGLESCG